MIVTELKVENFLSYPDADVIFSPATNIITGANAAGKTNLIDAIYYSSIGRGSRVNKDKDLINWASREGSKVTVCVKKRYSSHKVEIYIDPQGKKRILVDRLPLQRIGELMGVVNVVLFSPTEMKLVKDSPIDRRRFMDISLSQQSKLYFYNLQKYNSLLEQRNKILKVFNGRSTLRDMLATVDGELIRCAECIFIERKNFVEKIAEMAKKEHYDLTNGKEELKLIYETEDLDFKDLKGSFKNLLDSSYAVNEKLQYTTVGPHRDDIKITVSDVDIRKFGSQGQQRTAVLSLKLAEIDLFKERTGESPILLLDDVLSELDKDRKDALLNAVADVQTMITCTEFEGSIGENGKKFFIQARKVNEVQQ